MSDAMSYQERRDALLVDGNIICASTGASIFGTIHGGRVNLTPDWPGVYSMSPLCTRYRKANGERLAKHERGGYPMLVRSFAWSFEQARNGDIDNVTPRLCAHCVAVFDADKLDVPIVDFVKLSRSVNRAVRKDGETDVV